MNSLPPPSDRLLGIDVGQHKIGLAVGDAAAGFVFTRPSLRVTDWSQAWPAIQRLMTEERITKIVIGWPLNTDGTAGPQAEQSKLFARQLGERVDIPIEFIDERLTTRMAQAQAVAGGLKAPDEDSLAAKLILEAYLTPPA